MPLYSFEGKSPRVHPTAFIAPTATLVGDVIVEEGASVWYNAVIRADFNSVLIRAGANVQDGSVIHSSTLTPTEVGLRATVGHLCVIHGALLEEECLVANGATVLDGAKVGARSLVAAGAVVTPGMEIPEGMLVVGAPARIKGPLAGTSAELWVKMNPRLYPELAQRHRLGIAPVP
jgi:carbonic anhydrase/acetyltransferase-like protein (isoleucine patch superfamily)